MNIKITKPSLIESLELYFKLINFVISDKDKRLSNSEIRLLALFMSLDHKKFQYQRFSTLAKKKVLELAKAQGWKLTSINITNKLYSLILKEFLTRDEDNVIYVSPKIVKGVMEIINNGKIEVTYEIHHKEPADKPDGSDAS